MPWSKDESIPDLIDSSPCCPPRQGLKEDSQHASQVVLDLDETLVSSYNANRIPEHLLTGEQRHFMVRYNPGSGGSAEIAVFPRPGVMAFLRQLSAFAEVILYTAGNAGTSWMAHLWEAPCVLQI